MLVPLATSALPISVDKFYHALQIYHDRPHLVNKKLSAATTLFYYNISFKNISTLTKLINYTSLTYETGRIKSQFTKDTLSTLVSDLLLPYDNDLKIIEITHEEFKTWRKGVVITVRLLLPKNESSLSTVEIVVYNFDENCVQFLAASSRDKHTLVAPPFAYKFAIQNAMLQLICDVEDADTSSGEWLADRLFSKILKWCEESEEDKVVIESLGLVSLEHYFDVYRRLKVKYGKKMVEIWPENTDPLKFVYEDVAIATYLICLWNATPLEADDSCKKPSFVDLGCGNGLLVYILCEEGYPGLGIDVRRRKIWDFYPETTRLEIKTIVPSDSNLFPDADWIIGNHSDELTPWIPVMAARSSSKTNFFVLPCCSYNFDGSKYQRKNTSISQYAEYLHYVEDICNACGFITEIDKLRIPSTKRTCLVGRGPRTLTNIEINTNIKNLLAITPHSDKSQAKKCKLEGDNLENNAGSEVAQNQWINNYQARESIEKVRNCTKLNRNFVLNIVGKLVKTLLSISPENNVILTKDDKTQWNAGVCINIAALVKSLQSDELKQLKSECGGLQTLLRNHRYVFDVEKGIVKVRPPYLRSETTKYTEKPCWFFKNHPDGCLYDNNTCAYSHL